MTVRNKESWAFIAVSIVALSWMLAACNPRVPPEPRLIVIHDDGTSHALSSVDRRFAGLAESLGEVIERVDAQAPATYTSEAFVQEFGEATRVEADYEGDVNVETVLGAVALHRAAIVYAPEGGTLVLLQDTEAEEQWRAYVTSDTQAVSAFWESARSSSGLSLLGIAGGEPYAISTPTVRQATATEEPSKTATHTPVPTMPSTATQTPTLVPTSTKTHAPTPTSTMLPTMTPTLPATIAPTLEPSVEPTAEPTPTPSPTQTPAPLVLNWHREGPGICDDVQVDASGVARFARCGTELREANLTPGERSQLEMWRSDLSPFEYHQTYEQLDNLEVDLLFEGLGDRDVSPGERGALLLWVTQLYTRLTQLAGTGPAAP